jgi:glycosyltransferase involved in cell wall biosynthesis
MPSWKPISPSIVSWLGSKPVGQSASRRICLVTPGHLSTNPRLVKEADALTAAGHEVSIVSARFIAWADAADDEFANRPWRMRKVAFGPIAGQARHLVQSLRRRLCLIAYKSFGLCPELAFHPVTPALAGAARAIQADLYIAHNLAALPAAYRAAKKHGAKLGFDAEDFHSGELNDTPENMLRIRLTREIERRYLPRCDYLTAASPGIAKACAETYGVRMPTVILNVFPKADAPPAPTPRGSAHPSPSLYWFSQTIGPDRGLETVVEAIARSHSRPTLFLRGNPSPGYQQQLTALAEKHGIGDRLRILPPAPPSEMIRLAAEYDAGIASEPGHSPNNRLALSNKLFTYMLAGVPTIASATTAQSEIAAGMPDVVFVHPQQNAQALAARMDELLLSPRALENARQAAWQLGQVRFNWDMEQRTFLQAIESAFEQPESTKRTLSK